MKPSLSRVWGGIPPVLLFLFASCGGVSQREGVTPTQAHMYAHFDRAGEVHDAVVRGDLNRARSAAAWIATHQHPQGLPGATSEFQAAMQEYATQVSQSNHLEEATMAATQMGRTCGDCHRENGVSPRFLVGTVPPGGEGPKAEMALHVWASERMWEGLMGPGDHAWTSGARALREGWLDAQELVSDPEDRARIRELIRQVYTLGGKGESATEPQVRAELYAEFLNTCMECHRLTSARIR